MTETCQNVVNDYLTIQNIHDFKPDTNTAYPVGYADFGRGGTTFLNVNQTNATLMLIEFRADSGPRGRHKHALRYESFYIISGCLKARYWLHDPDEAIEYVHRHGTLLTLKPGLFHEYECVDGPALALEFSPQPYDRSDHYYPSA